MRHVLNSISMDGIVVIGEGEKDEVPFTTHHPHGYICASRESLISYINLQNTF